jgi:hypothetical protein
MLPQDNMKKIILLIIISLFVGISSCKKNQLDGTATITGTVRHHAKLITNATVFIKFKATEFPGSDTTQYDAKVKTDANGKYSIKCYKGEYYLFGSGYDFSIPAPYHVVGGAPVKIRNKENLTIDLAVTEGD